MTAVNQTISIDYYSDVLCIWAYIAQARVDEIKKQFGDQVEINYRVCKVFADIDYKMQTNWKAKGGYEGFAEHLHEVAGPYDHIELHKDIWLKTRPASSIPAHLIIKAVQKIAPEKCLPITIALREAFFREARDIADSDVLEQILEEVGVPVDEVNALICSGQAHALLEADMREKDLQNTAGSPTYVLNDGRQKLYGNVGYGVIEANIKELLRSPHIGVASWC
ncbi:MAG: DsbA family protein [Pseudomonadales bacterium]|nr:DsbA family protein [Pseudomonadales bacterium]